MHHGFRAGHNTTTALIEIIDRWIESFEKGKISAVVALDMSAAFDLVDKSVLLKKFEAFKADRNTVAWIDSYLSDRYQRVYIDGALSEKLPMKSGVPQGSILGPLLYIIYTSDLPHTVHRNHLADRTSRSDTQCNQCGALCCYADDSTFTVSGFDPQQISHQISEKYKDLSGYMRDNRLVLNSDKTHVIVMASVHKHKKHGNFDIILNTGSEVIEPSEYETLLGADLSNNFQWNQHIRDGDKALIKTLTKKNIALKEYQVSVIFKQEKI